MELLEKRVLEFCVSRGIAGENSEDPGSCGIAGEMSLGILKAVESNNFSVLYIVLLFL